MTELKLRDDRKDIQKRAPLSPKLRYNVLRRDGFTCQYCGRTGQERELEIDHIVPVSKGGTNDIGNLQTACKECNRGKLTDDIIAQYADIKVVEKIVYKEVPVEKAVNRDDASCKFCGDHLSAPPPTITSIDTHPQLQAMNTSYLINIWAKDNSNPELAEACKLLIEAHKDKSSKKFNEFDKAFAKALLGSGEKVSKNFAKKEMAERGNKIKEWSQQNDNILLKACALQVLNAVGT